MKTAVVILNWNTREFLSRFLPPLLESVRGLDASVIVADNASTDGSLDLLLTSFPEVRTIVLDKNYGFTGGYNRALAQLSGEFEYYLLLNSDIETAPGWLEPLVEWMDSHPDCGVCGPKLHSWYEKDRFEYAGAAGGWLDRYGYPFCRGRIRNETEEDHGQYDTPRKVMWVSGACLMTRSSLWESLGGFDERFFAHMDEIDYCWRAQLAGFYVSTVPASTVWHVGGGTLPPESPFKLQLNFRNNLLMLRKNLPRGLRYSFLLGYRYLLDCAAWLTYLILAKYTCASAVVRAHKEYRQMKGPRGDAPFVPEGMLKLSLLRLSRMKGAKKFEYLRKFESKHLGL
ncbi:MAG: glycosyltransferase family 2 protein [Bacteroidales bacterium]|nr:glycosyltransferase family 2 protein [Bacteroidales bacterium]